MFLLPEPASQLRLSPQGMVLLLDQQLAVASPIGIKLTCAGSGIVITAGGIVVTAAQVSAGAGPSQMKTGKDEVLMKSKQVTIEAETTCRINGKRVLKLNSPQSGPI